MPKRFFSPPEFSVVDSFGKRTLLLAIDIMVEHGDRFFCTFRYKATCHLDMSQGWLTDCDGLWEALIDRYPSLKNRKDVVICLEDATPIQQVTNHNSRPWLPNNKHYDKVRNQQRTGRAHRVASR